jgi:hypothetical protein
MSTDPTEPESPVDSWGIELILHGNEEILKGSDTGTLIAFAAIAYQQIKGESTPSQQFGCGMLVFSVFMCAFVHLSIGNAYIRRAKAIMLGRGELVRLLLHRRLNITLAWIAVVVQFTATAIGTLLIFTAKPPPLIDKYLLQWFR